MDDAIYKTGKVLQATGISRATLKNWERKERQLVNRHGASLFTFRQVLHIAIMGALVDLNMRPEFASRVAQDFTETGEAELPGRPAREPGEFFPTGWTVLCIYPGEIFDVKNVQPDDASVLMFIPMMGTRSDVVTAVNLTFLAHRLRAALED